MTEDKYIKGILRTNQRGFGFVKEDGTNLEVFIPKSKINDAIDGDLVEVLVNPIASEKGYDGEISGIIKRFRANLTGTIYTKSKRGYLVYSAILGEDWPVVLQTDKQMQIGDRVKLKVVNWEDTNKQTLCNLEKKIGNISDPSKDALFTMEAFNLPQKFSSKVEQAAKKLNLKDKKGRKDLTDLFCVTIDPDTAKDFDDAISITADQKGQFELGVHIADVAHFIKVNSILDTEAAERCNSVYFPEMVIPMLPHALSSDLCSLKPDEDRFCISVFMQFNLSGELTSYYVERTIIKSKKRLSYQEAKVILDSGQNDHLAQLLHQMVKLCSLLKKQRMNRGSIDFSMNEAKIRTDSKGNPLKIELIEYDITHQMIEEFMLKANEVVAKHLTDLGKILIYRTHEKPSESNFNDFFEFARSLGFKVPMQPSNQDIQNLFKMASSTAYLSILSINFIRSMKLASYSIENIGHYGLALEHYCHFTSPIRRYTDLITQRLLFNEENKDHNLNMIATACSEKERISFKAEMQITQLKKLRLLKSYQKEDPTRLYSAIITRVKPFGIVFELSDFLIEGFLHVSEIYSDYYNFDEQNNRLIGSRTKKTFSFGDKIQVRLEHLDLIFLSTKWKITAQKKKS